MNGQGRQKEGPPVEHVFSTPRCFCRHFPHVLSQARLHRQTCRSQDRQDSGRKNETCSCLLSPCISLLRSTSAIRIPVSMGHPQPHSCMLARPVPRQLAPKSHLVLAPRNPILSNPVHRHFAFSGLRCSATLAKHTAALFDSTPTWRWAVNCDLSLLLQPYS